ncbi:hypothetical protein GJAV_G00120940 [Gymnothorax javanicus]|nr:hypothetical protein GJAV_G00120940 [Gymnothorax javanicus]
MWNDTVRKQSESSFISGDINSTSTLNQGHSLSNVQGSGLMDTLPLNGNFDSSSYSLGPGESAPCGLALNDAAFEKMIISELVQNNLRSSRGSQSAERGAGQTHGDPPGTGLEAPLLPQRTHSLLYPPHSGPGAHSEAVGGYLTEKAPPTNRDSLCSSLPNLTDTPQGRGDEEGREEGQGQDSPADDIYYTSHTPPIQPYYLIKEDPAPEGEAGSDGQVQQLVTSL